LSEAIKSAVYQTYKNVEIIVIDNNSTDNTKSVVDSFHEHNVRLITVNNNGIIAYSRNIGIAQSKGEWIAFLDSDDSWHPNKLKECIDCINYSVDIIYHDLIITQDRYNFLPFKKRLTSRKLSTPIVKDLLINGNALSNSAVMIRKSIFNAVGDINESGDMVGSEDYNYWLRCSIVTEGFYYLPVILGEYYRNEKGVSNKNMYNATKEASRDFIDYLDDKEIRLHNSLLSYIYGRYEYIHKNYTKSEEYLKISLFHRDMSIVVKSYYMMFLIKIRKYL